MYRGFNIQLNLNQDTAFRDLHAIGQQLYADNLQQVQFTLNTFVNSDNSLDGTSIQNFWFPQIESDIFISHSHKNKDTAIALAGWLWSNFKLKAFIDSCIWGYADNLLKTVDNAHCWKRDRGVYDYNLRNHSTSHIHMMLSTSVTMMIDKSECLFFLNTPNAVKSYGETDKTESAWIYSEIATTKIIRKREPKRKESIEEKYFNADGGEVEKAIKITHDIDLSHLTSINLNNLTKWEEQKNRAEHPLDTLYRLHPPKKISNQLLK